MIAIPALGASVLLALSGLTSSDAVDPRLAPHRASPVTLGDDAALHAPDAGMKGLDPIVILDAILGTPDNLEHWEDELRDYSSRVAPQPRSKREKPHVSPKDLADRLQTLGASRARAMLRQAFGDVTDAAEVLERLAQAIRVLEQDAPNEPVGGSK